MNEQDPSMKLHFGDREFEATPDNTTLFRFMGQLAMYNHVFFATDEENGVGTYLFNQHPFYQEIEAYMVENKYPTHDNLRAVAECDVNAFKKMVDNYTEEIPDYVPDDWQ